MSEGQPKLASLLDAAAHAPKLARLAELASGSDRPVDVVAVPGARPLALAQAARHAAGPVLAITATSREAEELAESLASYLAEDDIAYYPAWETLPHERLSPRSDTVGARLDLLHRIHAGDVPRVIVTPVRGALQPQLKGLGSREPVHLRRGDETDLTDLAAHLVDLAYERVDLVEKRGEFAVRGGILDVFPPTAQHPLRLEFFGDEVDTIREFSVADQRSLDAAAGDEPAELRAVACRELLLTDEVREKAAALGETYPGLAEMCAKLAQGIPVEGMESLLPALAGTGNLELFQEVLPRDALVVAIEPERIRTRALDLVATSNEFLEASWAAAAAGAEAPVDLGAGTFHDLAEARTAALAKGQRWWTISPFAVAPEDAIDDASAAELAAITGEPLSYGTGVEDDGVTVDLGFAESPRYHGNTAQLVEDLRAWTREGRAVAVVYPALGGAERAAEQLRGEGIGAHLESAPADFARGEVVACVGTLALGFISDRLVAVTAADIAGGKALAAQRPRKGKAAKRRGAVNPLELSPGDFVVHDAHGVGKYVEMVRRAIGGAEREYLVIEYAASKRGQPGDRLFVPTDSLDQLTRYVGGEQPTVHKLGGADWQKTKRRARKAVREIAAELIQLYAARQAAEGHAFSPDTPWQRELEDAFPYIETPDQLSAIIDTKADMEARVPMDRLVMGDVGYGKTEVAVRAAFKAVQDGKQVAVLVPTTLLASQHYGTFVERMGQFPVKIKQLSRFQSAREAAEIQRGIAAGEIDILVGTHRLLQAETRFKDLGLIIVDEEQRFGVEHKEKLKALRTAVDVLTMSATPIPRTLEMAVTGIREMSQISTPPEERHPVLTYVGAWEGRQVAAAIRRELLRDGQAFYLHNRVESIDRAATRLRELIPEARIAVAHGKMSETQLEQIMQGFWEGEYDVLVSTTIIESGIDIPNANTLIVERADLLGLSQLHQIRGRVGRSRERAYAYFLYPPEQPLSETAHERLATIAQHSELGAGMYVAMKDLEIRGAGNLLGAEQSGHIADVGFDLYLRMVGEAVTSFKGGAEEPPPPVKVELPLDANIPFDYIEVERLRLEMYRKVSEVRDEAELDEVREEMEDRYGPSPEQVLTLFHLARFRLLARRHGLTDIALQGKNLRFSTVDLPDSKQLRLGRHYPDAHYKAPAGLISVPRPTTSRVGGKPLEGLALLQWCADLITDIVPEDAPVPA
ncbi:transcription-repair coupling factor [Glycomyces artemisiae]|uniref:Transcription-repair-coupling factor n=1 Tax=Glycomyces artemisiae TaxID=1076443 RepID=A0A2T0UJ05_9ACTN|nr:transcription-repair coupling factor [Glycomyces artemisiae]PRY57864.1 transcription-repair coupling factor [Glycomyces artemisiae]